MMAIASPAPRRRKMFRRRCPLTAEPWLLIATFGVARIPLGVTSKAQASTSAIGKPTSRSTMTRRNAQTGRSQAGKSSERAAFESAGRLSGRVAAQFVHRDPAVRESERDFATFGICPQYGITEVREITRRSPVLARLGSRSSELPPAIGVLRLIAKNF